MKLLNTLIILFSITVISSCSHSTTEKNRQKPSSNYQQTARFYQNIINQKQIDQAKLTLFFMRMPKGGDLHLHYSGTLYAETYLDWVKAKGWFIDKCTLKILKSNNKATKLCPALNIEQLLADNSSYRRLLTLWSDKDYKNHFHLQPAPDSNFFRTFPYFSPVSQEYIAKGLTLIKQRAESENVSYIETMLTRVGVNSSDYFPKAKITQLNKQLRQAQTQKEVDRLLDKIGYVFDSSKQFSTTLNHFIERVKTDHKGLDDKHFTMRFQTYAVRVLDPLQVFADLYSGYLAAQASPLIVGVNIVAPENNYIALADYTLHMRMYHYLLTKYPAVNRALHAGELTLGMVRVKDLSFHINEARSIAQAQRIGHGVDLPYEANMIARLKDLKENAAVEINLTSNQFILGVEKGAHPYQMYADYGVPLVICTDDSGVSRNNLSHEYMLLASQYKPDYARLKSYVYNSINYSFLGVQDKKKQIAILDKAFLTFEKEIALLAETMQ